jgi:hypothetical protein
MMAHQSEDLRNSPMRPAAVEMKKPSNRTPGKFNQIKRPRALEGKSIASTVVYPWSTLQGMSDKRDA